MNIVTKKNLGDHDEYQLNENGKTILKVMHRRDLNTARVETTKGQRVLIIENEGLIKERIVIKNEYGVEIGQLAFNNWSDNHGIIQIENFKYKFHLNNREKTEMLIFNDSGKTLLYQCLLSFESDLLSHLKEQLSAITVSIAWSLHLKSVGEKESMPA